MHVSVSLSPSLSLCLFLSHPLSPFLSHPYACVRAVLCVCVCLCVHEIREIHLPPLRIPLLTSPCSSRGFSTPLFDAENSWSPSGSPEVQPLALSFYIYIYFLYFIRWYSRVGVCEASTPRFPGLLDPFILVFAVFFEVDCLMERSDGVTRHFCCAISLLRVIGDDDRGEGWIWDVRAGAARRSIAVVLRFHRIFRR